jgi:hypothetical protein
MYIRLYTELVLNGWASKFLSIQGEFCSRNGTFSAKKFNEEWVKIGRPQHTKIILYKVYYWKYIQMQI